MAISNKRKVDEQSRLPLPLPMRQQLNLNYRDAVVWYHEDDHVVIKSGGKIVGNSASISTRVDDVGKVQVPRTIAQLGLEPGVEVELTCDGTQIVIALPTTA